jgi:hypothetical protein
VIDDGGNTAFQHLRSAKKHGKLNLLRGKMIQPTPNGSQPIVELKAVTKACS